MKKSVTILLLSFFLIYCENTHKDNKIVQEKPVQSFLTYRMEQQKFVEIDIDLLQNFGDMLNVIDTTDCRKNASLFKIETDSTIYKIQHLQFCESIFDYKLKQIIYINTDSIKVNDELSYPIDNLDGILKNHLVNEQNDENYPSTEKRLISIHIDESKNIKEVKKLLLNIISTFNSLQMKTNFAFMFDRYGMIKEVPF
ncbi:hypothetical protein [uncultured Kordia sp.]|uniref:hypothetical protein n=1 Tax=uncultured Kordia sp. TaxID=507699 RepID=UPI0026099FE9|nr:hypothetical protein [uncultured Kordia sp.]